MNVENTNNYHRGRGAQLNTHNKYMPQQLVQEHIEGLDEDLPTEHKTEFFHEYPKKIVNKPESADMPLMYSVNPYQGCEHGCIYCYARNAHEYWGFSAGIDFETKIMVKPQAPQLLQEAFEKPSWQVDTIMLSGNTDCYQPAERKYQITRKMLEICLKYRNPVGIITKNALVLRDIDILSEMAKQRLVTVHVSLTTLNESLRLAMEPRTVTGKQRLRVIEKLTAAGIPVGVMTAPIIPALNSYEIPKLIEEAANHGALGAGYTIVRLNGSIGPIFTDWVHKNFPDRANKVLKLIKACHAGHLNDSRFGIRKVGDGKVAENIRMLHKISCAKFLRGREFPKLDKTSFRRPGQIALF